MPLLTQPFAMLAPADALAVARVEQDADAAIVAGLACGFTTLVRACNVGNKTNADAANAALGTWLAEAGACGVRAMEALAAGLEAEGGAIRVTLTTPRSNGQTEGQATA